MKKEVRVAIIGAGIAGEYLLNELENPRYNHYNVIGFIDDNEKKIGTKVKDIEVLDTTKNIPSLAVKHNLDLFIIAMPSIAGQIIQRIVNLIKKSGINFMIVPPIFQNLHINQIAYPRNLEINDLLRRPIENVLTKESMNLINNSTVLITGVAGSIGSEICNQIASCKPKKIIGVDVSETPLFSIINEITDKYPEIVFSPILCSIQDKVRLEEIFSEIKPEIVYHCAAYKHVGLMESFPHECVKNNIQGSMNVIEQVIKNEIKRFVFVSSDKAVNPNSIMGASKRIIEKYILSLKKNSTKFMIVRFGNVLESNGSAIPIFKEQILKGGPVTITDMNMERYFMTITEAAQLVIQASFLGEGGELFVLDMGEPYKIIDIVNRMIDLSGFNVGDIPIEVIGSRPGEKLIEELFFDFENPQSSKHKHIFNCYFNSLNNKEDFQEKLNELVKTYSKLDNDVLKDMIFKLAK